MVNKSCICW